MSEAVRDERSEEGIVDQIIRDSNLFSVAFGDVEGGRKALMNKLAEITVHLRSASPINRSFVKKKRKKAKDPISLIN